MGKRAKWESWWAKGMSCRCLGNVKKPARIESVLSGLEFPRWLLSELVSDLAPSSFISQGSLRRNQSSQGCRSSSDIS